MSLEHAIMGFLSYRSMSGYDLKSIFDISVRHFWPADQSQIYRTLSRLAERGWANIEVVEQDDRPDRKVYHLTKEGRGELHRWLAEPLALKGQRIPALVQVFFAGQLSDEEVLAIFRGYVESMRSALATLQAVPGQGKEHQENAMAPQRDHLFWHLTLEYGLYMSQANLAWFEDVIARIERGDFAKGEGDENTGG